jgi:predicted RNase H-like nuclease (RuvC/YqgF family)
MSSTAAILLAVITSGLGATIATIWGTRLKDKREDGNSRISEYREDIDELKESVKELQKQINELQSANNGLYRENVELRAQIENLTKEKERVVYEFEQFKVSVRSDVKSINNQINNV